MKVNKVESRNKARTVGAKKIADGAQPEKKPRAKRKAKQVPGETPLAENKFSGIEPRADAHTPSYQKSGIDLIGIFIIVATVTLGLCVALGYIL